MATKDENLGKELETLRKDLASLRGDIGSLSKAVKAAGEQKGEAAYRRVREQGESAVEKVGHTIDQKPVTSVLTAFGTGVLVGVMLMLNQRRN